MKVLVSGAAGFIGSHLCEGLQELGHEVVGIDNFSPYYGIYLKEGNAKVLSEKNIKIINADLRTNFLEEILSEKFNVIFHLAAHPGISSTSSFEDYYSNNIMGTQRLLDFALSLAEKPFFVNIATSSIYGLEATFPETQETKPASWYGVSKLAAEQLVMAQVRENQLKGTSLRLYSVYGPRERPDKLYTRLLDCGMSNMPFPLFKGSEMHVRSFTYVEDIVKGIVSVLGKEEICNNEIFNLGTEEEHTTAEGIKMVEDILQKRIQLEILPPRNGDQSRTKANIDKAKRLLGYHPKTKLYDGLKLQKEWFVNSIKR